MPRIPRFRRSSLVTRRSRRGRWPMSELSVLILCGRSPRHLYVANRLCRAARPLAIVQETGTQWSTAKLAKAVRPANLWRKGWRWLRDRRRYVGGGEAKFFFGDAAPKLD